MRFSLADVLEAAAFTADEVDKIRRGELVKGVLASLSDRELAVKFAFMLQNTESIPDIFMESRLKKELDPAVQEVGHLIEDQDGVEAFAALELEPNSAAAVKAYLNAAPGEDLNLSKEEIDEFQALRKKKGSGKSEVEAVLRQQLLRRYNSYRELGVKAGIAPYIRARNKPYSPGDELEKKTTMMTFVQTNIPDVYRYLVEYPNAAKPDGLLESFSWTNSSIDDLPTIALVHKVGYQLEDGTFVFFQRMFYVNRSHNSVQGMGGCFPVEDLGGNSRVVVITTRTSTDKVAGFGGAAKKAIGSRLMSTKQAENFERLRQLDQKK